MGVANSPYLEIIDFIAAGVTPDEVIRFRPSQEAQQRVDDLVDREKEIGLSPEEKSELELYGAGTASLWHTRHTL